MQRVESDGGRVARFHLFEWVVLAVLTVVEGGLQLIHPFERFVSKRMMEDLNYPLKRDTVPMWAVPLYAVMVPILIFAAYYFRRRNLCDLHNATLGLLYAVAMTAAITDTVKNAVGRPRPDFFWRCFPDAVQEYDSVGNAICHGVGSVIREGYLSFPSGHSSMSFAGLGFLSYYLCGKMRVFDHKGHVAKLCVVILPLLAATLIAVSRVDDYRHHWEDVFAGALLGIVLAFLCYHQFFPSPNDANGGEPYAWLARMEGEVYINGGEGRAHV